MNIIINFSAMAVAFTILHMPIAALACVFVVFASMIRIDLLLKMGWLKIKMGWLKIKMGWLNAKISYWNFLMKLFTPKALKEVPKDFTVTKMSLDSYLTRLRQEKPYKKLNDAAILSKREDEMKKLLTKAVKIQYGSKGKLEDHFIIKASISFEDKNKILMEIDPKTKFAEQMCKDIMNETVRRNPDKEYLLTDEEEKA